MRCFPGRRFIPRRWPRTARSSTKTSARFKNRPSLCLKAYCTPRHWPRSSRRSSALEVAGVHVVDSERIVTEAIANLDVIEGQLARAAKALGENNEDVAATALSAAVVRGVDFRFNKDDSPLVVARDALWLARRSLEENNVAQAVVNLESAKQRLRIYREVLSQDERQDVDLMLREVQELENQLRGEANQPASRAQRSHQGNIITSWWDKINSWFRGGHNDQKSQ